MMADVGFIGMGNMGYAMLNGAMTLFDKADIIFTDVDQKRVREIYNETGVRFVESNAECANGARYIILAVKPQYYPEVIKNIKNIVTADHVIISIAPGITMEDLRKQLGFEKRIVRAMPNTPALIGEGVTAICYDKAAFNEEETEMIHKLFGSFGKVRVVEERLMNAVVCASGSSPAYVYMFIEALADSVVKYGMPREMAYEFVSQSLIGSAKMVLETKEHPGKLKDMVCSPGGTTIAGVAALEEFGFRNAIIKATDQCYEKSEHMK